MKKVLFFSIVTLVIFLTVGTELSAQCPMCRMAAETNLEAGGTEGRGLNTGILYMLTLPYLLIGTLGFIWWKNKKKADSEEASQLPQI